MHIGYVCFLSVALVAAAGAKPAQGGIKASIERGKKVYETTCLPCHQADGSGVPNLNPPLKKTPFVSGEKKQLIEIVLKGLDKELEVNGEFYNNVMPAQSHLSDLEVADVLTYVRNSFENKASAITAAEVKKYRTPS